MGRKLLQRNSFILAALLAIVFVRSGGQLQAQIEADSFAAARRLGHHEGSYSFNGAGRLNGGFSQTGPHSNAQFFDDKAIRAEIELVDFQRQKYNAVVSQWQASWEDAMKQIQQGRFKKRGSRGSIATMLADNDEKSLAKLREVLLPHQLAIIRELQFRCLFRTQGIAKLLENDQLRKVLELSNAERKKLETVSRKLRAPIKEKSIKAAADSVKTFLRPLTPQQQEKFVERWSSLFAGPRPVTVEELLIKLDPTSYTWIEKEGTSIERMVSRPQYSTGAAGQLVSRRPTEFINPELGIFRELWANREFKNGLELSEDDRARIDELIENSYGPHGIPMKVAVQQPGAPEGTGISQARLEELKAEYDEFEQPALADIKRILGPSRWDGIEAFVEKINLASAGPLYDLLAGPLQEEWRLTSKQTDQLRSSAKLASEELVRESQKIEAFVIKSLAAELDEVSEQKFLDLLGQPIKETPANLTLLQIQWENIR
ncbi:hypothetical protein OAG71_00615 [bacterium]|nr:hypothetical protein [bacterium]